MPNNPYADYSTLPSWGGTSPEIDGSTGWSTTQLNNLYNVFSGIMDDDFEYGSYNMAEEEQFIRGGLTEDAKSFGAKVAGREDELLKDTIGAHKKIGKAGLARSGGGLRALSEMKDQYGEDMLGLRKDMEAKRLQAISDIAQQREDWKSGLETLYLRWVGSGTENMPDSDEQQEATCAMSGGTMTYTWSGGARRGECSV